jgi:hypothetical protein
MAVAEALLVGCQHVAVKIQLLCQIPIDATAGDKVAEPVSQPRPHGPPTLPA